MKNLKDYLHEELFATPMNTTGMGNVSAPSMDNSQVGSGDMIMLTNRRLKKKLNKKKLKRKNVRL